MIYRIRKNYLDSPWYYVEAMDQVHAMALFNMQRARLELPADQKANYEVEFVCDAIIKDIHHPTE